tara:strand:- start:317 stop:730 length:414 start_codon:yes stop_codon:yes gene_type:complete
MSFAKQPVISESNQNFLLQMVPNPTCKVSDTQRLAQTDVINQITRAGKDLFETNPAVSIDGSNYKSRQLYNRNVTIDDLAMAMDKYNLVMQVNLKGDRCRAAMATADQLRSGTNITSPSGSFSLVRHGKYLRGIDAL